MEHKVNYLHAALLLHSAGKPVDEEGLMKVVEAAGAKADHAQVKALVANLEGVNIEQAIASAVVAAPVAAAAAPAHKEDKAAKKDEEDQGEKKQEEAIAGLSALFG